MASMIACSALTTAIAVLITLVTERRKQNG